MSYDDAMVGGQETHARVHHPSAARLPDGQASWQAIDQAAEAIQAVCIVFGGVMRHATHRRVHDRPAEGFGINRLAGRTFDEVGTAESHERRPFDHHDDIGQRGQVRATGDALAP